MTPIGDWGEFDMTESLSPANSVSTNLTLQVTQSSLLVEVIYSRYGSF